MDVAAHAHVVADFLTDLSLDHPVLVGHSMGTQVVAQLAADRPELVAHSKGGLVGKQMLIDDAQGRIAGLVAIATPFHGSSLASLLPTPAITALHPDDPTIRALASHPDVNTRITSIYPVFDPHIPESSHLAGATNIEVRAMGHFLVLDDDEVLDAVVTAVGALG